MGKQQALYCVHPNKNRGGWSVLRRGRKTAALPESHIYVMHGVGIRTQPAGQALAKKTGVKNVHAFITSTQPPERLELDAARGLRLLEQNPRFVRVDYHPSRGWHERETGQPWSGSPEVYLIRQQCWALRD